MTTPYPLHERSLSSGYSEDLSVELEGLAQAIDGQELDEAHVKTIREGWTMIGEFNDALDRENGVARPVSHLDSLALAWGDLTSQPARSPFLLHDKMVKFIRRPHRAYLMDLFNEAANGDEAIDEQAAAHLRNGYNLVINAYDLTSIARSNLSAKIRATIETVAMSPDIDLTALYTQKLGVRSQRTRYDRSTYPEILKASGLFEGLASNEINKYIAITGANADVSEIKALLKAAYYLTGSNVASKELASMRRLRLAFFASMMKGQTEEALKTIEEIVLTKPAIATPATYALLGFSKEERDELIAASEEEREAKRQASRKGRSIADRAIDLEKETYTPWLEANAESLKDRIGEIVDDADQQDPGRLIQFGEPAAPVKASGRPAMIKYEFDVFQKPGGELVFSRHIGGYVRASVIAQMLEEGTLRLYDTLDAYTSERLAGVQFEEIRTSPDGERREVGVTQRHGGVLVRAFIAEQ